MRYFPPILFTTLLVLSKSVSASEADTSWTGAINSDWLTAGNWSELPPAAGTVATFASLISPGGTYTITIAGTTPTAEYLNFEAPGYLLTATSNHTATALLTLNPTLTGTAISFAGSTTLDTLQIALNSSGYLYLEPGISTTLTNQAALFGDGLLLQVIGGGTLTVSDQAQLGVGLGLRIFQSSCINDGGYVGLNGANLTIVQATVTNENGAFLGTQVDHITLGPESITTNGSSSYFAYQANSLLILDGALSQDASSVIGPVPLLLLSGTIHNDGILYTGLLVDGVYQNSSSAFVDGAVTGSGQFYLAQSNSISAPTTQNTVYVGYGALNTTTPITAGTVSGSLEVLNVLNAQVIVTGSGTLLGDGTVSGAVSAHTGSLISPGRLNGQIGQLTFSGTTTLNSNATLQIDFDSSNHNDLLFLNEGANLFIDPSAKLHITTPAGFVAKKSSYTLVELDGGIISGTFTLSPLPSALKYYALEYATTDVSDLLGTSYQINLIAIAPPISTTLKGQTANERTVAATLNSLYGQTNPCLQHKIELMSLLASPSLRSTLNQLQPSAFKAQHVILEELNFTINRALADKLYTPISTKTSTAWNPFIIAGYDHFNLKNYSQYAGAKTNAAYQLAGCSLSSSRYNITTTLGASQTFTKYSTLPSNSQSLSVLGGFGGCGFWGGWVLGAEGLFGYNWIKTTRFIEQFSLKARSNHRGYNLKGHLHTAYSHSFKKYNLKPYETLSYQYASEGAFTETGAQCLNLTINASSQQVLRNDLGLNFAATTTPELNPFIDVAYVYEKRYGGFNYHAAFIGTDLVMKIKGLHPTKQYIQVLFGFKGSRKNWDYSLKYNAQFGKRFQENGLNLSADYRF